MTKLIGIKVRNVKGISEVDIHCDFFPNQPNFLVAPNGTGKSSLAIAFDSLNNRRMKLDKQNFHRGCDDSKSSLEVHFESDKPLVANKRKNEIGKVVDTFVINSGLYAHAVTKRYRGRSNTEASVRVPDVILWEKIPERTSVPYKITDAKKSFPGSLGKIVFNLESPLKNIKFLEAIMQASPNKISPKGKYSNAITNFLDDLDAQIKKGSKIDDLKVQDEAIKKVVPIMNVANAIQPFFRNKTDPVILLNAVQICELYSKHSREIGAAIKRLSFEKERDEVNQLIKALNTTGRNISIKTEKRKVLLKLPDRSQLSNGELDVLKFASMLVQARKKLMKPSSILIIDEVFDYLDDANLLIAQHFLLKMMAQYKSEKKELYVILLTHLSPESMSSYRFKNKHVSYFSNDTVGKTKGFMQKILSDRNRCQKENPTVYEELSSMYFHYSSNTSIDKSTEEYLRERGVVKDFKPEDFRKRCQSELEEYIAGKPYDILMTCCAIRTCIEKEAFDQLDAKSKQKFLDTRTTDKKLDIAENAGAEVPELHRLLGIIYNPALHLSNSEQEISTFGRKLDNRIIKSMIRTAFRASHNIV